MAGQEGVVNNQDIVGLYNRINRFMVELSKSVSGQTSQTNAFDQTRLTTYLDAVDTYHSWVVAQPHLDCPESHPIVYTLETAPEIQVVENESINDIVRIMTVARIELVNAQSARDAANLNEFDSARLRSITEKVRRFLEDYIKPSTPLDLPESTPKAAAVAGGEHGV